MHLTGLASGIPSLMLSLEISDFSFLRIDGFVIPIAVKS